MVCLIADLAWGCIACASLDDCSGYCTTLYMCQGVKLIQIRWTWRHPHRWMNPSVSRTRRFATWFCDTYSNHCSSELPGWWLAPSVDKTSLESVGVLLLWMRKHREGGVLDDPNLSSVITCARDQVSPYPASTSHSTCSSVLCGSFLCWQSWPWWDVCAPCYACTGVHWNHSHREWPPRIARNCTKLHECLVNFWTVLSLLHLKMLMFGGPNRPFVIRRAQRHSVSGLGLGRALHGMGRFCYPILWSTNGGTSNSSVSRLRVEAGSQGSPSNGSRVSVEKALLRRRRSSRGELYLGEA